ncbi:MAG: spore photoproduct lyase [Firmicutes bacterium]|jgi:spore photoproduct lyase|nr:spore photoproduct lyase [Bacillota bacterium]
MEAFIPRVVFIQKAALEYPLGSRLMKEFTARGIEVSLYEKRVPTTPGLPFRDSFFRAKRTMVVLVRTRREFQTCKPSAHYQLPLVSGCPGHCKYCYLNTNLGKNPFVKVYVNIDEILEQAEEYVNRRKPEMTLFEGSATSDPVAVEPWTGSLQETIEFIASLDNAGFRFATKYGFVKSLLELEHNGKTEVRFSINSAYVVKKFEAGTPPVERRLKAAREMSLAGYPLGFLIGPIIHFSEWRREYSSLLSLTRTHIPEGVPVSFELITHRFTKRAKSIIEQVYPDTEVPLDEKGRRFKYGQFGYGKYVYEKELMDEMEEFFRETIGALFPEGRILYFV